MKRNMKKWLEEQTQTKVKKPLPILSFPAIQLMGVTVRELISDSDLQAEGMARIAERVDAAAAVSLMDLSVEAECFGAQIVIREDEVPTVKGAVISSGEEAEAMAIPPVGAGRTGLYIDGVRKAVDRIGDRPVFAGMIGPYSLAGRLLDVTEIMYLCYDEPETVQLVLDKATEFLIAYGTAYKAAGANGILMAEPLAGVLSPAMMDEFSSPYVKKIVDALQDDSFLLLYHNCGNNTVQSLDSILSTGAAAYHFGNAVSMKEILDRVDENTVVMGNIDPAGELRHGTPESVKKAVKSLLAECGGNPNFILSTGCDVPPMARWENIDAFFDAAAKFDKDRAIER